jgi:uncharacterized protein involved in propanediol utilization
MKVDLTTAATLGTLAVTAMQAVDLAGRALGNPASQSAHQSKSTTPQPTVNTIGQVVGRIIDTIV